MLKSIKQAKENYNHFPVNCNNPEETNFGECFAKESMFKKESPKFLKEDGNISDRLAFIYDIPKDAEQFTNARFVEHFSKVADFANVQVQIVKEPAWAPSTACDKPYWSARVIFESCQQKKRALNCFKYFKLGGVELRMLGFEQELRANSDMQARNLPDNSAEKCNICVKGIPPNMTQA